MGSKILYIDMDNVLVDFPSGIARIPPEVMEDYISPQQWQQLLVHR